MSRAGWRRVARWGRFVAAAAVLAALVWRVGADAFLTGLRRIDAPSVIVAVTLNAIATVACAQRWRVVAAALGARIERGAAVAAYYRAQFLNTALPGGVLGDVHRGVRHGRESDDVGRGLRAVAWERGIGQAVQVVVVLVLLMALPSPLRGALPYVGAVAGLLVLVVAVAGLRRRWAATVRDDARALLSHRVGRVAGPASLVMVAAHVATFVVAARTAGAPADVAHLLPLAGLVLLAMGLPLNVGGWGPREGVAAWAFAAAGMTAAQGVAAATVYGVLVVIASLPGAAVLLLTPRRRPPAPARVRGPATVRPGLATGGRRG